MVVSVWQVHFLHKQDAVGSRCAPLHSWGFNVCTDDSCVAFVGARESAPRCAMLLRAAASVIVLGCAVQCDLEQHRRPVPSPKGSHCPQETISCLLCCFGPVGRIKYDIREPKSLNKVVNH